MSQFKTMHGGQQFWRFRVPLLATENLTRRKRNTGETTKTMTLKNVGGNVTHCRKIRRMERSEKKPIPDNGQNKT